MIELIKKHLHWAIAITIIVPLFYSCKKYVEVDVPKTQLYTNNVFNDNNSATSAVTAIYSQMEVSPTPLPYFIPLVTGLSGDELVNYSSFQPLSEIYQNNIQTTNSANQNVWSAEYKLIYQANAVLEGLNGTSNVSDKVKAQLSGEAKFIRGFCQFYLTNLYGDVPIITSTDYKKNSSSSRSPQAEAYNNIVGDLTEAYGLLNTNFVAFNDTTVTTERIRPTKWAAKALLARVYLYLGQWDKAEAAATEVISNSALFDTTSISNVFAKNSKEAIWQLQPVVSGYNTPEGQNFILTGPPSTASTTSQCTAITPGLYSAFESGDLRKTAWVGSITSGGTTYYYPNKYKVQSGTTLTEYSTVLRISEQYLIRAEARARQSKFPEAQADLNVIRKRARLSNTLANSQSALLDAILLERRAELFCEWGSRWLDLKRMGKIDQVMGAVAPTKGATWASNKQLYPVPQNERNNDPNLSQNEGY